MTTNCRRLSLVLFCVVAIHCTNSVTPIPPDPATVHSIDVYQNDTVIHVIDSAATIEEIVRILREDVADWAYPDKPLAPAVALALFRGPSNEILYELRIGSNWISGDDSTMDRPNPRVGTVDSKHLERLENRLGV